MSRVFLCVTQNHDPAFILLAGLVCLLGMLTSLSLVQRAGAGPALSRTWVAGGAVAGGSAVWATHFVAMLGYAPSVGASYALAPTLLSILLATGGIALGFRVALGGPSRRPLLGGALFGLAVAAMHYVGAAALEAPVRLAYHPSYVLASLAIGILFGAAGFRVALVRLSLARCLVGALLLAVAICGLHFTAIAAADLVLDPLAAPSSLALPTGWIAVVVALAATLVIGLAVAGSIVDQQFKNRAEDEAARLRLSEARFRQLADATFEGIVIHIDGILVDANRAFAQLVGRPVPDLIGRPILSLVAPASQDVAARRMASHRQAGDQITLTHADGTPLAVEILAQNIEIEAGPARVVAVRDIRERLAAEERIRHLHQHDVLTGLPNRTQFLDRLEQLVALAERSDGRLAVLCLNLDRFKTVNDVLGHRSGDTVLREAARRLEVRLGPRDTAFRLNGDEFAIIQVGGTHPADPAALAERLVESLAEPFPVEGTTVTLGASIGVALFPEDALRADQLVTDADAALGRAKQAGRGRFRFFEARMDERLQERRRIERDLREAMSGDQFELHYQPIYVGRSGRPSGCEALLRWRHPERGLVSPADFIPIAEESGLILALGDWVLRTACREALGWHDQLKVAVNLSPVQFHQPDLVGAIAGILEETGLDPHRLELEITEGVLIGDAERVIASLTQLKALGIGISLDDFGTGYSSLGYLQRFPFDKIKIDKAFVSTLPGGGSVAIIRAIVALARSLDMAVTAEGVETAEQLALLRDVQCDLVQGYLLSRPLPAARMTGPLGWYGTEDRLLQTA